MFWRSLALATLILPVALSAHAQSAKRVAMVVGVGNYASPDQSLLNPPNDARDIAQSLRGLGYEVIEEIDSTLAEFMLGLQSFGAALENADTAIFYYAGHGMEYAGRNYLFPADARLDRETDVRLKLVDVDDVLWTMETAVPTRLMFLDACRDNPLALSLRQSLPPERAQKVRQGMTEIETDIGTFMAFATAPGEVAFDGDGDNSPFTEALLNQLTIPGQDIESLMRGVRNSVIDATQNLQVPFNVSSLREAIVLNTGGAPFTQSTVAGFGAGLELLDISMNERIVFNCNKSGNTPHFGLAPQLESRDVFDGPSTGLISTAAPDGFAEQVHQVVAMQDSGRQIVLVQGKPLGCSYSDRVTTDGRGAQWRAWRHLTAAGGNRVDREKDNWSGPSGSFRIESDIVLLDDGATAPACRAFVGFSDVSKRAFAGYACASATPSIAELDPVLQSLQWPG